MLARRAGRLCNRAGAKRKRGDTERARARIILLPLEVILPKDQSAAEMSGQTNQTRPKKKNDAKRFAPMPSAGVALGQDHRSKAPDGSGRAQPSMEKKDLPRSGRAEGRVEPA